MCSLCSSICKINNLFCNALREKSESNSLSLFKIRKKIESGDHIPLLWHQKNLLCLQSLLCPSLVLQLPNLHLDSCFCFGMGFSFHLAVDVILPGEISLPLDVSEVISPLFVTKDVFAGVHDDSRQYAQVCLSILRLLFGQSCAQSVLQLLLVYSVTQQLDVALWPALSFCTLLFCTKRLDMIKRLRRWPVQLSSDR